MSQGRDAGVQTGQHKLENVVEIFQAAFHDRILDNKSTWQTVLRIIKGYGRDLRNIGLVVVLWDTTTGLLN